MDPEKAYTVGLLHDIGRLLLELAPPAVLERRDRLRASGVDSAIAELLTCGTSHAEAGADVLELWNLPEEYMTAVAFHHEPDRCDSVLASLLYVVEFWTASEEDLPSSWQLRHSLDQLGLTLNALDEIKIPKAPEYFV